VRTPLFRGTKRWLLLVTSMLLFSILFVACGQGNPPSILDTAGPIAASESGVFWAILIIATIVFVVVESILIFFIIRYRGRPGDPAPRQVHGNTTVEIAWTIAPAIFLIVVLIFTIRGLFEVAPSAMPSGVTVEVEAIGHQWWWEFYYPQYHITTADSMMVPVGTTIHVTLYSNNVIHSFWVPQITGKTDVIPGHMNDKWFVVDKDKQGKYLGICAEYCGTQHANMRFEVVATSSDAFQTWISTQQQAAAKPTSGLAADGAKIFANQCTGCHGIVGVNLKTEDDPSVACNNPNTPCLVGPNLTHFGSRDFIAGGVLDNNPANLAKWLKDTQAVKPGNDMVVQLTNDQINALIAYLESLK